MKCLKDIKKGSKELEEYAEESGLYPDRPIDAIATATPDRIAVKTHRRGPLEDGQKSTEPEWRPPRIPTRPGDCYRFELKALYLPTSRGLWLRYVVMALLASAFVGLGLLHKYNDGYFAILFQNTNNNFPVTTAIQLGAVLVPLLFGTVIVIRGHVGFLRRYSLRWPTISFAVLGTLVFLTGIFWFLETSEQASDLLKFIFEPCLWTATIWLSSSVLVTFSG